MILILTQDFDPIADRLVVELGRRGAPCFRWHVDSLTAGAALRASVGPGAAAGQLRWHGRTLDVDQVRSVWNRRPAPFRLPESLDADERLFAERENQAAVFAFLRLADWFWINHPDANRRASNKLGQLAAARRLGLEIPRTLMTNDPDAARAFVAEAGGPVVYKTLHSPFIGDSADACFTSVLSKEHLDGLDLIRHTPGLFQEYVAKRVELRIIVVGERLFAAEIHSQEADAARVDWRQADARQLKHAAHDLPVEVAQKCRALVRDFDLAYGAIDMIVTPDGRYVFLENNPAGQYGWIEDFLALPITAAVADLLIAGDVAGR